MFEYVILESTNFFTFDLMNFCVLRHAYYVCLHTLELLKFYGSHHKDYADCQGTAIAHDDYVLF